MDAHWPDGGTTVIGGLAATGCIKQQTALFGLPWERPLFSSGLQQIDDDDDDMHK